MTDDFDVAVVGAGVVGTAIARATALAGRRTVLLDAGADVGAGTSKANTAILHTGFDAKPGTLEARLVARGQELLGAYAARTGIAVERTGALLVAWTDEQADRLPVIAEQAATNGRQDVHPVDLAELGRREPALGPGAVAALAVPGEAIIDPWSPPIAFATEAVHAGASLRLRTRVTAAEVGDGVTTLRTSGGDLTATTVVNAAGLGADLLDREFGHEDFTVTPRRGELIVFDKRARSLLRHVLLPVPTATTKGVLVSPTVFGNVLLGPTAEDLTDRTDTGSSRAGLDALLDQGRRILPGLVDHEVTAVYAGLRAATEHADYVIRHHPDQRYLTVGGIRSTGLTAALAIAEHVLELLGITPGDAETPDLPNLGEAFLRPHRDPVAVAADPEYGRILCHCERVSAGEVRDALAGEVPATDLDGLRRRTRAAAGRCQQFACAGALAVSLRDRAVPAAPRAERPPLRTEVAVVGGGPAGLALAEALAGRGAEVVVLEREVEPGGIPRVSHHRSFGLELGRLLRGPDYARRRVDRAVAAGATIITQAGVTGWGDADLVVTSPTGPTSLVARAVVLATGCRERPRSARLVPGDRPAGVWTTGQLQQLAHLGLVDATRAVVVGAEPVSFSAALTLRGVGAEVVMVTPSARHDWFPASALAVRALGVRLRRRAAVVAVHGRGRVEAVSLADGTELACDTVVFTGDWVPEDELLTTANRPVLAVGGIALAGKRADQCVRHACAAVDQVTAWLESGPV